MRRRNDGDHLLGDIDAEAQALFVDAGKALFDELGAFVPDIEINEGIAAFLQLMIDRAGDDIARSQLLVRMVGFHKGRSVPELQDPPFAADRLARSETISPPGW